MCTHLILYIEVISHYESRIQIFDSLRYRGVILSFTAFVLAGCDFFLSTILWIFLTLANIHPEDYDAAENWQESFQWVINVCKALEILSIAWLNVAAIQLGWLRVNPSGNQDGIITAVYFVPTLTVLALVPVMIYKCHIPASKKLTKHRGINESLTFSSKTQAIIFDSDF